MAATAFSINTGTQDRPLVGIGWALSAEFILSVMDGLIKWSVGILPVAQVVVIRSAFVLLLMAPMIMRAGGSPVRTRRPLAHFLRVALAVTSILTFFEALRFLPIATVIAIGFGAPLLMTALSVPVLGERVGAHRWTAIAVGFVGVLIITWPGREGLSWPALLALVSSALFASHLVAARYLARTETDTALMFWQNLGVFVVSPRTGAVPLDPGRVARSRRDRGNGGAAPCSASSARYARSARRRSASWRRSSMSNCCGRR